MRRFGLDLCLGRMVGADDLEPVYVGRLGLTDALGLGRDYVVSGTGLLPGGACGQTSHQRRPDDDHPLGFGDENAAPDPQSVFQKRSG